jgi:hypothetical protein
VSAKIILVIHLRICQRNAVDPQLSLIEFCLKTSDFWLEAGL